MFAHYNPNMCFGELVTKQTFQKLKKKIYRFGIKLKYMKQRMVWDAADAQMFSWVDDLSYFIIIVP